MRERLEIKKKKFFTWLGCGLYAAAAAAAAASATAVVSFNAVLAKVWDVKLTRKRLKAKNEHNIRGRCECQIKMKCFYLSLITHSEGFY